MADTLAAVHAAGEKATGPVAAHLFDWLTPHAPGLDAHPWLPPAIDEVRTEVDTLNLTCSLPPTDPAPEAFVHDDSTGITGLIDWTGAGGSRLGKANVHGMIPASRTARRVSLGSNTCSG